MSWRSFYWQWLCKAFAKPFLWAETLSFFLLIILGPLSSKYPTWGGTLNFLMWVIPLAVFVGTFLVGLALAPYYMNKDARLDRQQLAEFVIAFNDHCLTTPDNRAFLGVNFLSPTEIIVDNIQLEVKDRRIQPTDSAPLKVKRLNSKHYEFPLDKLRAVITVDSQYAGFVAMVNGVEHKSEPFKLYGYL